jgi:hypothetical protein
MPSLSGTVIVPSALHLPARLAKLGCGLEYHVVPSPEIETVNDVPLRKKRR